MENSGGNICVMDAALRGKLFLSPATVLYCVKSNSHHLHNFCTPAGTPWRKDLHTLVSFWMYVLRPYHYTFACEACVGFQDACEEKKMIKLDINSEILAD